MLTFAPLSAGAATVFDAAIAGSAGHAGPAGRVSLDGRDMLHVLSAVPARAAFLRRAVAEANATTVLQRDVAPAAGGTGVGDETRPIHRGDPAFRPALLGYLRTYYGLSLKRR
jgi:hypothetical protein